MIRSLQARLFQARKASPAFGKELYPGILHDSEIFPVFPSTFSSVPRCNGQSPGAVCSIKNNRYNYRQNNRNKWKLTNMFLFLSFISVL